MPTPTYISENRYLEAVDCYEGFCTVCRDFTGDRAEPDATGYECPDCNCRTLVGAEQALLMGLISFDPAHKTKGILRSRIEARERVAQEALDCPPPSVQQVQPPSLTGHQAPPPIPGTTPAPAPAPENSPGPVHIRDLFINSKEFRDKYE